MGTASPQSPVLLGCFEEGREYPESQGSWCSSCSFHNDSLLAPCPLLCEGLSTPRQCSGSSKLHVPFCPSERLWHQALSPF